MLQSFRRQCIVSEVKVRDQAHRMSKKRTQLLCSFRADFNLILVAVIVGQVEAGQALVANQAAEQGNGALCLDVVAAK